MHTQQESTTIYCDNKSAIALSNNHFFHKRIKHIDTRYHFVQELVNNGEISLQHCRTEDQVVDIFTKALPQEQFVFLRDKMNIVNFDVISGRNQKGVLEHSRDVW